ncbi:MAG: threonine--tRNA ligase [Candidatus Magasanikbacteria bacterium]
MNESKEKIDKIRHSLSHILAAAVLEKWPEAKLGIGPTIENGFYYDILFPNDGPTEEDLKGLEDRMEEIINEDLPFSGSKVNTEKAKEIFSDQPFKLELIEDFSEKNKDLTIYKTGEKFKDLCKGGHVERTSEINPSGFTLDKIAGAYWKGDEENKMLTRIYGLAFETEEELEKYIQKREEAKQRDHRKLNKKLNLFLISDEVGKGLPIFTREGEIVRDEIKSFINKEKQKRGYEFVKTPHIAKSDLYHKSGHWGKYDAMFKPFEADDEEYVVKPMNCPHHFQIYNNKQRSYKELPIRLAENGTVYRYEQSGELSGLFRVRSLTIDDTHIFLREEQIKEELRSVLALIKNILEALGFEKYRARISARDPESPEDYLGSEKTWQQAENALKSALEKADIEYEIGQGEAAFYGPKIDIMLQDALKRDWQLSTIQLDYNQPKNFDMTYKNEKGKEVRPTILHVATTGSIERILGILIEHYKGKLPTWLHPTQVQILPISEEETSYGEQIKEELENEEIRVEIPNVDKSLSKRIRNFETDKIPYALIVGPDEKSAKTVSIRHREKGDIGEKELEEFKTKLLKEIEK